MARTFSSHLRGSPTSGCSRIKDFYDIAVLAERFGFEGDLLGRAIRATFERRATALPTSLPVALTDGFSLDPAKTTQWTAFVRKTAAHGAGTLPETTAALVGYGVSVCGIESSRAGTLSASAGAIVVRLEPAP